MNEYVPDGGWDAVRRNFEKAQVLSVDTGGQSLGVRFGTDTASFSAASNTGSITVAHGLGKTPEFISVFPALGSVPMFASYIAASRTDTEFDYRLDTGDGSSVTEDVGVFWMVIG